MHDAVPAARCAWLAPTVGRARSAKPRANCRLASFCLAPAAHSRYPGPLPPYKHSPTPNMALRDTKEGAWTYGFFNDLLADPAVCE